ncbi:MAG: hypothetical protein GX653_07200 [Clostridiales bacterium]|nr:hypothetical protein [Clostridiales bacterium]
MSDNRYRYSSAPMQNIKRPPRRSNTPQPPRKVGDYQDEAIPQRNFAVLQIMLTIALPLLFIVALLVRNTTVYTIFAAASAACLVLMWLMNAFVPNARMTLSFIHIAMILVALFAIWMGAPQAPAPAAATQAAAGAAGAQGGDLASIFSKDSSASMVSMTVQEEQNQPAATNHPGSASMAQQRLEQFMAAWINVDYKGMVELSTPSWVSQQKDPEQAMFFIKGIRTPVKFSFNGISGSDADNTRTIDMVATIDKNNGQAAQDYQMQVLMMRVNDLWYVDPTSLASQQLIQSASSTAVPVVTVAPMVTAAPSLQLYYNPAGGMLYHVNGECPSIAKEYLPLTGFLFSQVNDAEFSKLDPCSTCHAPSRQ